MEEKIVRDIPVDKVIPNPYQPRKVFSDSALEELSKSIQEYGVLQPITVRQKDNGYELVAGERRLRAAKLAKLETIPAIINNMSDQHSAVLALLENLQREDLNFIEESLGYENLIKEHNFTQQQLAEKLGKNQSTIANKLRILKLPDTVKQYLVENGLTERHARALLSLPNEKLQLKVIKKVIANSLNVKKTEELINTELLKLAGEQMKKRKGKGVLPGKLYVNTIKQVLSKFNIPAEYKLQDKEECIEITVSIPKNK